MSDLHGQIMNLQCKVPAGYSPGMADEAVYRIGHRDARHAAAELALRADACIEALRDIMDAGFAGGPQAKRAREALAALDGPAVGAA